MSHRTISLPRDTQIRLAETAERLGISQHSIIKLAVLDYLDRAKRVREMDGVS